MQDREKSREQLIDELEELRIRLSIVQESENALTGFSDGSNLDQAQYLEELEDFYQNTPCGYHSISADGKILRINNTELGWLGYCRDEVINRLNITEVITPDALVVFEKEFPKFKKRGWLKGLELEFQRKDGSTFPVLINATAIHDDSGNYLMSRTIVFDITERKKIEERFRRIFERHQAVMLLMDPASGLIIDANNAAAQFYGYSRQTLCEMKIQQINCLSQEKVLGLIQQARQEKHNYFEFPHRLASGEIRTVEVHSSPIETPDGEFLFSIVHDVTNRKKAEKNLRDSENKFRQVVSTTPDAIFIARLEDGFIHHINDSFVSMFGYTQGDLSEQTMILINLWDDPADEARLVSVLNQKGVCANMETVFRRKDGSRFTGMVSASLINERDESRMISIVRDISDRILAQQQRQQLEHRLFESEKYAALGTLVGGLAHDFNNMLQIISGYSEIMMDHFASHTPEHQNLENIFQTSMQGAEIIAKLLAFGQKSQVISAPLDLNEELRKLCDFIGRAIPDIVHVETDLEDEPAIISADRSQVIQMMTNLAINASEAMPEGGRLKISTRKVRLDEDFCRNTLGSIPGHYIRLSVADTGLGMHEETLSKVFDPFFTTKQRGATRGTGLGLSVVKGMVQQHGGFITCSSKLGEGTEFKLYFPVVEPQEVMQRKISHEAQTVTSQTILLVEDVKLIAEAERKILEKEGYRVLLAENGQEAIEKFKLEKDSISLVIMDLVLPIMSGRESLIEILKIKPSVKTLILSGYSPDHELCKQVNSIAHGFLRKPCSRKDLLNGVGAILQERQEWILSTRMESLTQDPR